MDIPRRPLILVDTNELTLLREMGGRVEGILEMGKGPGLFRAPV
jgi:hypothetical protein